MKLVLLNLRELWKRQRIFLVLIVMVQGIAAFCLALLVGVIINNQLFISMDYYMDGIDMIFTDEVNYEEIEETLLYIYDDVLQNAGKDMTAAAYAPEGFRVFTEVRIKDGEYLPGTSMLQLLDYQLVSGRNFTEEDLNSENGKAIVANYESEKLIINGKEHEIIGDRGSNDEFPETTVFVTPNLLYGLPMSSIRIWLNRYITEMETEQLISSLDKVVSGRYELYHEGSLDDKGDVQAAMRSVILSCVLIGGVLLGTLTILYQHIMDKRKYKTAVFRLTGCSATHSLKLFALEMLVLSIPSVLTGFILFLVVQKKWLEDIYPYMKIYLNSEMYLRMFLSMIAILIFFIVIIMAVKTLKPVKKQLLNAKN